MPLGFLLEHWAYPPLAFPMDAHNLEVTLKVHGPKVARAYVHHGDRYTQEELTLPMASVGRDLDFQYFRAIIPSETRRIRYFFRVEFQGIGLSAYLGESGTFLKKEEVIPFQFPYIRDADIYSPPSWLDGITIYQVFPERFYNGNPGNDPPGTRPWSQELGKGPGRSIFYGGDLEGIVEKLDYIKNLGTGLLYLTPVFTSPSSHKYDVSDYEHVDPHFGGDEALKRLSYELHTRGMKLMLDIPLNHSGDEFFPFKDLLAKGQSSQYAGWFYPQSFPLRTGSKRNYAAFAEVDHMPKLRTSNSVVKEYLLEVVSRWTEAFSVDGWRLDVANEVDHCFWRDFRKAVRKANPSAFILGEIWHNALPWLYGDQFDSVLNYPWRNLALSYFTDHRNPKEFAMALTSLLMRYPSRVNGFLVNLLGSHDTARIMTMCAGNGRLVNLLIVFLFLFPGIPLIYYGDEAGMEGGNDPDCRRPMVWDEKRQRQDICGLYKAMVNLRKSYPWLSHGPYETLVADDESGVYGLKRSSEDRKTNIYAVFNPTKSRVAVEPLNLDLEPESYKLWIDGERGLGNLWHKGTRLT